MPVYSDDDLLRGARDLNQTILVEVFDRYSPGIFAYAYRLLGDSDSAEDCVAETFSRFLQALKNHRGPTENIRAYLYRIAHNWINDIYRSRSGQLDENLENIQEIKSPVHVEDDAEKNLQKSRLREMIMNLSPDQQLVITLRYIEGWNLEQVAKAIQKPVGAVKALQHRGLSVLQKKMAQHEDHHES